MQLRRQTDFGRFQQSTRAQIVFTPVIIIQMTDANAAAGMRRFNKAIIAQIDPHMVCVAVLRAMDMEEHQIAGF